MKRIIVAIDGYSSCGKSTVAKALAKKLGLHYIDSGAMYRAVTHYFLTQNIPIPDPEVVNHNGFDYAFASGFVSLQGAKNLNIQFGHGKQKIGKPQPLGRHIRHWA